MRSRPPRPYTLQVVTPPQGRQGAVPSVVVTGLTALDAADVPARRAGPKTTASVGIRLHGELLVEQQQKTQGGASVLRQRKAQG